eukprot:CAMPEP_0174335320 /NCGR_PEP_ID=MMETSP0810-20121108/20679_1 /TAXON_ID=73025 ORGANISM="Eutreptiella gymnastica-like, Strain CCMP1594" /NCGR_SAMPLE_ID=MMETSP0810 /ASSEMBLY_ACC=CAM_ASM_000659 /LENGTH=60 /DNA_ID=CAMNT_0015453609 /DNA_START=237 /DNA_END=416 /DNA_ORIENTATION=+
MTAHPHSFGAASVASIRLSAIVTAKMPLPLRAPCLMVPLATEKSRFLDALDNLQEGLGKE